MPERMKDPTQFASGYTLDLYCDTDYVRGDTNKHAWNEFPHQFMGETLGECARAARRRGWIVRTMDRTATCPKCSGKKRRVAAPKQGAL